MEVMKEVRMRDHDFDFYDEDLDELERRLDEVFAGASAHRDRFLKAISDYLKALPSGTVLSDIPVNDLLKLYDRTAN
jgi:hypothetical protein